MNKIPLNTRASVLSIFILPAFVFFLILLHSSIHSNAHMSSPCIALGKEFEKNEGYL
jgi:hypothetical protein